MHQSSLKAEDLPRQVRMIELPLLQALPDDLGMEQWSDVTDTFVGRFATDGFVVVLSGFGWDVGLNR
jgi:hypothetical protein